MALMEDTGWDLPNYSLAEELKWGKGLGCDFALMEDTGWYLPNYSLAEELKWGKGLGCDFALKSCKDWMESRARKGLSIHPYCNKVKRDPLETECTEDRSSV